MVRLSSLVVVVLALAGGCGKRPVPAASPRSDAASHADAPDAGEADGLAPPAPDAADNPAAPDVELARDAAVNAAVNALVDADGGADGDAVGDGAPQVLIPYRALAVTMGDTYACALRDNHSVFCWGTDAPKVVLPPGRTASQLAAARETVCAILDDGSVTCWTRNLSIPNTTTSAFDLGPGRRATQVTRSNLLTCVVLDDQTVRCASRGTNTLIQRPAGAAAIRLLAPGYGMQLGAVYEDGRYSTEVNVGLAAPHLLLGTSLVKTMAASRSDVDLWCWVRVAGGTICEGAGGDLQPDPTMDLTQIAVGRGFLCGVRPDGGVRCWGTFPGCLEGSPELSYWCDGRATPDHGHDVRLGQPAISVATNADFSRMACAVLMDGTVKCWGGAERDCTVAPAAPHCQAPAQQSSVIGDSVEIKPGADGRIYGAWRAIDLGSHPSARP